MTSYILHATCSLTPISATEEFRPSAAVRCSFSLSADAESFDSTAQQLALTSDKMEAILT